MKMVNLLTRKSVEARFPANLRMGEGLVKREDNLLFGDAFGVVGRQV